MRETITRGEAASSSSCHHTRQRVRSDRRGFLSRDQGAVVRKVGRLSKPPSAGGSDRHIALDESACRMHKASPCTAVTVHEPPITMASAACGTKTPEFVAPDDHRCKTGKR